MKNKLKPKSFWKARDGFYFSVLAGFATSPWFSRIREIVSARPEVRKLF
jgi:hypothetical protein